jgi:6-phosphogluconolactonase
VIVANYSGGNIAVFGKIMMVALGNPNKWFSIMEKEVMLKDKRDHTFIWFISPDRKFVLSNDLGNDKVYSYEYNPNSASTVLKEKDSFAVEAGSGPRHLTFSKKGSYVYVLQELTGGLMVFSYSKGKLRKIDQNN